MELKYLNVTSYLVILLFATLVNCGKTVNHDVMWPGIFSCKMQSTSSPLLIDGHFTNFTNVSYVDEDHTCEQARL